MHLQVQCGDVQHRLQHGRERLILLTSIPARRSATNVALVWSALAVPVGIGTAVGIVGRGASGTTILGGCALAIACATALLQQTLP